MKKRSDLHAELVELNGSSHVYYNPPETIKLVYPCVIYDLKDLKLMQANNNVYKKGHVYECTRISKNPDDDFLDRAADHFKYFNPGTIFVNDDLYHYTFTIYYG